MPLPYPAGFPLPQSVLVQGAYSSTTGRVASSRVEAGGVGLRFEDGASGSLDIVLELDTADVSRIALRWDDWPVQGLVLGDAWERSYGDIGWAPVRSDRNLPWYWAATNPRTGRTEGAGVRVRANAFCHWNVDGRGVTLWLDVRNGGGPLQATRRDLRLATLVRAAGGGDSFSTVEELCDRMNPEGPRSQEHLIGNNDWYYTYGRPRTADTVVRDAGILAGLAEGISTLPFAVVDCGWSEGSYVPGGPYVRGARGRFDDMAGLSQRLREEGTRPGIWIRPTATTDGSSPLVLRRDGATPEDLTDFALDISLPETLEQVAGDVTTVRDWGYDLIKYDFSTFDLFGRFHPSNGAQLTDDGWSLRDRTRTNAEVLRSLYRTVAEAGGSSVILGCNTVGHLAAGYVDANRTGDDTSGKEWARTRLMGVNTLAFRLPQHDRFFSVDADCIPCTPETPWERNREFLDLIARSGTALFVSIDPEALTDAARLDLTDAMRLSETTHAERARRISPASWEYAVTPSDWTDSLGEQTTYRWDDGAELFA